MSLLKLIGLTITAIKGMPLNDKRKTTQRIEPAYILFSDQKTVLELEEQDYYTYHDCSSSARYLNIRKDEKFWKLIFENYPDANSDI